VTISLGQGTCAAVDSSQTSQVQGIATDTPPVNPDCTVTIINKVNKGEIYIGKDDSQTAPANAVGGATFRLTLGDLDLCVTDGVNPAVANAAVPECANAEWVPDMAPGAVGTAKVTGLMLGTWHVFEVLEPVGYGPDTCGGERIAPLTATSKSWSIAGPGCTAASPGWTAFHNETSTRNLEICKVVVGNGDGYIDGGVFKFDVTGIDAIVLVAYEPALDATEWAEGTAVCETVKLRSPGDCPTEVDTLARRHGWEGAGTTTIRSTRITILWFGRHEGTANVPGDTDSVNLYNKTDPRTPRSHTKHIV